MPERLDFKAIAESVDISDVAHHLGIDFKKNRAPCPACNSTSERGLELMPETNSFRCWSAPHKPEHKCLAGDCISLYAHVATASRTTAPVTSPQTQRAEPTAPPSKPERAFDPAAFAAKLTYTDEVMQLGFSRDDADAFGIGFYRGHVYFPTRHASGQIAGWCALIDGRLKLPPRWIPDTSNVVALRRA
jgi:hypothetical protein